ncbi:hypothetical protein CR513_06946, partial [Mucuna pruriens]
MLLFSCDNERERESRRGSQEYSVTADERQTCRQGQSQILLFKTLHLHRHRYCAEKERGKHRYSRKRENNGSVILTEHGLALHWC